MHACSPSVPLHSPESCLQTLRMSVWVLHTAMSTPPLCGAYGCQRLPVACGHFDPRLNVARGPFDPRLTVACALQVTSYEMMQRLSCDACRGRVCPAGSSNNNDNSNNNNNNNNNSSSSSRIPPPQAGAAAAAGVTAHPCSNPKLCMAGFGWRVIIADGGCEARGSLNSPWLHAQQMLISGKNNKKSTRQHSPTIFINAQCLILPLTHRCAHHTFALP
jgi:hypothetical protein